MLLISFLNTNRWESSQSEDLVWVDVFSSAAQVWIFWVRSRLTSRSGCSTLVNGVAENDGVAVVTGDVRSLALAGGILGDSAAHFVVLVEHHFEEVRN